LSIEIRIDLLVFILVRV